MSSQLPATLSFEAGSLTEPRFSYAGTSVSSRDPPLMHVPTVSDWQHTLPCPAFLSVLRIWPQNFMFVQPVELSPRMRCFNHLFKSMCEVIGSIIAFSHVALTRLLCPALLLCPLLMVFTNPSSYVTYFSWLDLLLPLRVVFPSCSPFPVSWPFTRMFLKATRWFHWPTE